MKPSIEVRRASHVNAGTAVPKDELPWPEVAGRVCRLPRTHVEVDERSEVTPYGGLAIATAFLRRFKVAELIDRHVKVLLVHRPYHESDHVLAQALNLYVGGTCTDVATSRAAIRPSVWCAATGFGEHRDQAVGELPAIPSGSGSADVYSTPCIGVAGHVTSVKIVKAGAGITAELQRTLLTWRYKPYVDDAGQPSPACFAVTFRLVFERAHRASTRRHRSAWLGDYRLSGPNSTVHRPTARHRFARPNQ